MENKEAYQDHAARVRAVVKASTWTTTAIAGELGKNRSYVANVLSGRFMSRPVLDAIEALLGGEKTV